MDPRGPLNIYFYLWTPSLMLWTPKGSMDPKLRITALLLEVDIEYSFSVDG